MELFPKEYTHLLFSKTEYFRVFIKYIKPNNEDNYYIVTSLLPYPSCMVSFLQENQILIVLDCSCAASNFCKMKKRS